MHSHDHHAGCNCPPAYTRAAFLRRAAQLTALTALPGLAAACGNAGSGSPSDGGSSGPSSDTRVRIGYLPITDATPLLVAQQAGLLEDRDIEAPKPTLLRTWPALAEALQGDQVDAVHLLMPLALQLRFQRRFPVKVLGWNHTGGSAFTVQRDLEGVEDLAGTTVAIPSWFSIHNIVLQMLLRANDLEVVRTGRPSRSRRQVKLVVMGPPDMPPALVQGSIAGYIVADPFNAAAEVQEIGRIMRFTGDVWRDHACCVVAVNERMVRDRPEVAGRLMDGLVAAQRRVRDDREAVAEQLTAAKLLPQPEPVVRWALTHAEDPAYERDRAIVHPEWREPRIDFAPFPFQSYTAALIDRLRETVVDGDLSFLDGLDGERAHRELFADRFVRAAIAKNGGPAAFGLPASLERREEIEA
jgi:NitT/TauT family transport system substrate-binding protein